jgi:aspartyl-tRNA(Asn)/glutamyl-tRNA(Gln) amidotransferase subunit A
LGEKTKDPLQMYLADVLTAAANVAGIPGLAIPSGLSSGGLPLGFQLMGARFSEPTLFKLGKLYQKTVDWKPKIAFQ